MEHQVTGMGGRGGRLAWECVECAAAAAVPRDGEGRYLVAGWTLREPPKVRSKAKNGVKWRNWDGGMGRARNGQRMGFGLRIPPRRVGGETVDLTGGRSSVEAGETLGQRPFGGRGLGIGGFESQSVEA